MMDDDLINLIFAGINEVAYARSSPHFDPGPSPWNLGGFWGGLQVAPTAVL